MKIIFLTIVPVFLLSACNNINKEGELKNTLSGDTLKAIPKLIWNNGLQSIQKEVVFSYSFTLKSDEKLFGYIPDLLVYEVDSLDKPVEEISRKYKSTALNLGNSYNYISILENDIKKKERSVFADKLTKEMLFKEVLSVNNTNVNDTNCIKIKNQEILLINAFDTVTYQINLTPFLFYYKVLPNKSKSYYKIIIKYDTFSSTNYENTNCPIFFKIPTKFNDFKFIGNSILSDSFYVSLNSSNQIQITSINPFEKGFKNGR